MKCAKDIVQYYSGHGGDGRGRSLAEVQGWQDDQLEAVHDFIQWMFPLREYSNFNRDAPVLDDDAISQFQVSSELRSRLRLSFIRMLKFYGFEMLVAPEKRVIRSAA